MWGNELSLGRAHCEADSVSITKGGDWARVDIRWNDGAHVSITYDTEAEALEHVHRLGWA